MAVRQSARLLISRLSKEVLLEISPFTVDASQMSGSLDKQASRMIMMYSITFTVSVQGAISICQ